MSTTACILVLIAFAVGIVALAVLADRKHWFCRLGLHGEKYREAASGRIKCAACGQYTKGGN